MSERKNLSGVGALNGEYIVIRDCIRVSGFQTDATERRARKYTCLSSKVRLIIIRSLENRIFYYICSTV